MTTSSPVSSGLEKLSGGAGRATARTDAGNASDLVSVPLIAGKVGRWRTPRLGFLRAQLLIVQPIRRMVRRMPRVQVYLPDDLYEQLKRRGLPASELLQVAVRAELERREALDATDVYLTELAAEVGEPGPRQHSHADAIVRSVRDHQLDRVS